MDMIEIVAKALFNDMARSAPGPRKFWESAPPEVRAFMRHQALVAVGALMEPSVEMVAAGNNWDCNPLAGEVWQCMLQVALGGGPDLTKTRTEADG